MAFKFESEPFKFFTEWRNGPDFDQNMTEFTRRLRGNAGDLVQRQETVTVQCLVNETLSLPFTYDATLGRLTSPDLDFIIEGLFIGATVQVIQDGVGTGESEVLNITAAGYTTLFLDTTNLAFLLDGEFTDILIRVKDAPTYIRYQYGCIPSTTRTDTPQNYASPLDGNPQAYYKTDIVQPSFEYFEMERFGKFKGWDLTRDLNVGFVGTTDDYYHEYSIIHTFRILPYREQDRENIISGIPPVEFFGTTTLKYAREINLGYSSEVVGSVTDLGVTGDVGYYGENYNGKRNIFTLASIIISNSIGSNKLSRDEVNAVSIKLTNEVGAFVTDQKVVLSVFKAAKTSEYSNNQTKEFAEIFNFDSALQISGPLEPPVDSGSIQDYEIEFNDAFDIDVIFNVEFTADQKANIRKDDLWVIVVSTGTDGKGPDDEDNVAMSEANEFEVDDSVAGLITNVSITYHDSFSANDGTRAFTNQATWNGCFVGFKGTFRLKQFNDLSKVRITSMVSRLILVSDTDPDDIRELWTKTMPIFPNEGANSYISGAYNYQLLSGSSLDTDRLDALDPLNLNTVRSLPSYPAAYQEVQVSGSIPRIPWREWLANGNIPNVFFDDTEPNNNLNQKTSNYNDLNGYKIFHELFLQVDHSYIVVNPPSHGLVSKNELVTVSTPYHLRSDEFEVLDFDIDGNPSVVVSGEIFVYNTLGLEVQTLSTTEYRVIIAIINHDLGTLDLDDIWGEIWIEPTNGTGQVWQLHSDKNFSNFLNPLTTFLLADPLDQGFVYMTSDPGIVQMKVQTNPANITPGSYNIYYRLGKKTV